MGKCRYDISEDCHSKDCLVCVLNKIRSEIDSHCSDNRDRNDGLYIAMKIIEKYIDRVYPKITMRGVDK